MSYRKGKKTYYKTKSEALQSRRKWDRVYYDPNEDAFYIVRPKRQSFWRF